MKTSRTLRVSSYKDYVAVDITLEDGKIESTPFYLKSGETALILYKDQEENKWMTTSVTISNDFKKLICIDVERFEWESSFDELLDTELIKFKP